MRVAVACLALCLSASLLVAQENPEWSKYSSSEGKCEILFPGKVKVMVAKETTQVILQAQGGKAAYLLAFTRMPSEIPIDNKAGVKILFDKGRDGLINAFKGSKILKDADSTFAGYPAREIDLEIPALGIYRVRLVHTPPIFYQVVTLGMKDFVGSEDAAKFRASFKVKTGGAANPAANQWTTYSSAAGKCAILFPGQARVKVEKETTQAIFEAAGGKAAYLLAFTRMPNEIAIDNKEIVKNIFDKGRDGLQKAFKGSKILKDMDSTFADYPAREIDLEIPVLGIYRARLVLSPENLYQVVILGSREFVESDDTKKFRATFKVKK